MTYLELHKKTKNKKSKDLLQSLAMLLLVGGSTCSYALHKDKELTAGCNIIPVIDYKVIEAVRQDRKPTKPLIVEPQETSKIIVGTLDTRKTALREYFSGYNVIVDSDVIIDTADKYGVDYKKVVAIAGAETSFWKNLNFDWNAWGYGVWDGKQHGNWNWSTYENGLDSFVSEIANSKYKDMSINDMSYAGYNPTAHWRNMCNYFMNELNEAN